ncbi:hypothetical protein ACI3LY_005021 [Candidozyma auris]|uniref:Uncharacterized protein n=1 Tax=Candidozyma auris TaxID=498019 RepID=A0A9R1SKS8_CANAR|nr:Ran GTPase-binding protein MOG1 [[Candida] auris]KND97559.1 hypothetical protein QG37_05952 [[Candida] auris]PIS55223.1 hypothetical protein CJI97_001918 [[Candida] auris]QEO24010.1 hypothetical_protein [[Candida] auris]GBL52749.1 hypothetical protein CAJCM15448_50230 [[Candida] auris]
MTKLYGGAIKCDLPETAIDVSDFREVPDTQEVFILERPDGLDRSIIIDLLEMVNADSLPEIITIHLEDILEGPPLFIAPLESSKTLVGDFDVHFFLIKPPATKQETEKNKLFMFLGLIRLNENKTDVLLTFNVPLSIGEVSAEVFYREVEGINHEESELSLCYQQLKHWATSFEVQDWALFK